MPAWIMPALTWLGALLGVLSMIFHYFNWKGASTIDQAKSVIDQIDGQSTPPKSS